jgi:glycosyltransferase involved in cell wall biosynthesis
VRVLVVANGHPEEYPAGSEWAAYTLFQALRGQPGVEAHFAAPALKPRLGRRRLGRWARRDGEWRLPAGTAEHFLLSQRDEAVLGALGELLRQLAPDVVHFHHYWRTGLEGIALARRLLPRARILLTLHEFMAICNQNGQMVKTGGRGLCERASPADCAACFPGRTSADFALRRHFIGAHFEKVDRFISPSRFLCDRYVAWGIPAERIAVVENYLPPLPRVPPRPLGPGGRRSAFGYFGTIGVFKGVRELIEAFESLAQDPAWADATLRLNGVTGFATPEFSDWFGRALERNAPRLRWNGRYDRGDLPRLAAELDWVLVPSVWWENSPLVIQEARMLGRPLIVSDIGGMAEKVRHGEDGFTFPAGDSDALARTMAFAVPRFDAMRLHDAAAEGTARLQAVLRLYAGEA